MEDSNQIVPCASVSRENVEETFRPVLTLIWPIKKTKKKEIGKNNQSANDASSSSSSSSSSSTEKALQGRQEFIDFLYRRGITELSGLAIFGRRHFARLPQTSQLYEKRYRLRVVCAAIAIRGASGFLDVLRNPADYFYDFYTEYEGIRRVSVMEILDEIVDNFEHCWDIWEDDSAVPWYDPYPRRCPYNEEPKAMPIEMNQASYSLHDPESMILDHENISEEEASTTLGELFTEADLLTFMRSSDTRKQWWTKGALNILKRHPNLASHEFPLATRTGSSYLCLYPCFFFLFGGFGDEVFHEVCRLYSVPHAALLRNFKSFLRHCYRQDTGVPSSVIRNMIEMESGWDAHEGRPVELFEMLFDSGCGTDVLKYAAALLPSDEHSFCFGKQKELHYLVGNLWDLDVDRVTILKKVLPQACSFVLEPPQWTLDGFLLVLMHLATPQVSLESLAMRIPLIITRFSINAQESLEYLLANKGAHIQNARFSFDEQFFTKLTLEELGEAYARTFRAISNGISSSDKRDWKMKVLTLNAINLAAADILEDEGFKPFGDSSPLEQLFSFDSIRNLFVCLDPEDFYDSKTIANESSTSDVRIERLNLSFVNMSPNCWKAMWNKISGLKRVEHISLELVNRWYVPATTALDAMSHMSGLKSLFLGPRPDKNVYWSWDERVDPVDVTEPLRAILSKGVLESLWIKGNEDDDLLYGKYRCPPSYKIRADSLFQNNDGMKNLRVLHLVELEFEGGDVTKGLVGALMASNDAKIEDVEVYSNDQFYTVSPGRFRNFAFYRGVITYKYESYLHSLQLQCFASVNRFGQRYLQKDPATVDDVARLLQAANKVKITPDEKKIRKKILSMATEDWGGSHLDHLNELYKALHADLYCWLYALEQDTETTAILFGLLSSNPSLWSLGSVHSVQKSPSRKRKRISDSVCCYL